MKKRTIAALAAVCMSGLMLTACGNNEDNASQDTASDTSAVQTGENNPGNGDGSVVDDGANAGRSRDMDGDGFVEDVVTGAENMVEDVVTGADEILEDIVPGGDNRDTAETSVNR